MLVVSLILGAVGAVAIAIGAAPPLLRKVPAIAAWVIFAGSVAVAAGSVLAVVAELTKNMGKGAVPG